MNVNRLFATALSLAVVASVSLAPAAEARSIFSNYYSNPYQVNTGRVVRNALIGAGVGAAVGAVTGHEGNRTGRAVTGAMIGGVGGAGYGYIREKQRVRSLNYYGYGTPYDYPSQNYYPTNYYGNPYYSNGYYGY